MSNLLSGLIKTVKEILAIIFCATVRPSATLENIFSKIRRNTEQMLPRICWFICKPECVMPM